ncbi:hypothetical protein [Actinoallomurus iriomotensis]|uniref:PPE family protein n=1 Tax=Actinoallomurus iriomotensis TaxID=478107 RepID=A0A9W6W134_9ACTN|nr:hypothetical protein [Actinoallomurus iriomotensis]GLY87500.1 hypothetical protein Airi02_054290 [Actinoallomurus iriomotensis]
MSDYLTFDLKVKKEPTDDSDLWDSTSIYNFASQTRPDKVERVGQAYTKAAGSYDRIASFIKRIAGKIHDEWSDGSGSVLAQRQLAQLYQAAQAISQACDTVGKPIEHHGKVTLADFKKQIVHGPHGEANAYKSGKTRSEHEEPHGLGDSGPQDIPKFDPNHDKKLGAQHLLREHVKKTQGTYASIPGQLFVDLPPATKTTPPPKTKNPPPDGDGTGTTLSGSGLPTGSTSAGLPAGYDPTGYDPTRSPGTGAASGVGSGQGTDLSGLGQTASPGASPTGGTDLAGSTPYTPSPYADNPYTPSPYTPSPYVAGPSGSLPHQGPAGSSPTGANPSIMRSGRSDGLPTAAENAEAAAVRNAAARGTSPIPFMPGAAGPGSEKKDRDRVVWAYEDKEAWGAEDGDIAPPLIE